MKKQVYHTASVAETEALAEKLAHSLKGGEVLAYTGGMGMGKTAFTRGLARGLGIRDSVSSPTFALIHEYRGNIPLYHFDMYRVEGWGDLDSTGYFDYVDGGGVLAIEWSENIDAALPEGTIWIHMAPGEKETDRVITVEGELLPAGWGPCEEEANA
ncbi:MAG: tRNA (adenosine(37)-N6)-threonylcarbamoyltransferase complex ATPase subunit type 1 TsaE [Acutalibacteraceae bacterium]